MIAGAQTTSPRVYDCLIVGAGHAGAETASGLRQLGYQGSIGIVGDELVPPYERPAISKEYLAGKKEFEQLLLRPRDYWESHDVALHLGQRVTQLDPLRHLATCEDGQTIHYQALVWAAGGTPRRLSCPGRDLLGVRSLRGKADGDDLVSVLPDTRRFIIVGGGYIGLEAAAVLRELGKEVAVVEVLDRVLARVAGEPVSRFFENEHRTRGVELHLGVGLAEVVGRHGRVSGVRLDDGTLIEGEQVIVGIGMEPAIAPLLRAGAEPAQGVHGVLVDHACRTSIEDLYCVGDCAVLRSGPGVRVESRQNATEQARAAAHAICGLPEPPQFVPWFWSNQYDVRLQTIGLNVGHDDLVVRGRPEDRSFSVVYLKDGAVLALDSVNATRDHVQGRKLVEAGAHVPAQLLADPHVPLKDLAIPA